MYYFQRCWSTCPCQSHANYVITDLSWMSVQLSWEMYCSSNEVQSPVLVISYSLAAWCWVNSGIFQLSPLVTRTVHFLYPMHPFFQAMMNKFYLTWDYSWKFKKPMMCHCWYIFFDRIFIPVYNDCVCMCVLMFHTVYHELLTSYLLISIGSSKHLNVTL